MFVQLVERLPPFGNELLQRLRLALNVVSLFRVVSAELFAGPLAIEFVAQFHLHFARVGEALEPFSFRETKYEEQSSERLSQMFAAAARMVDEDPMNFNANQILCGISVFRRQYDLALSHADRIIRHYPESSHGYALRADALFGMERYEEAAHLYQKALAMGQTAKPENVYWNLHAAYVKLKEYRKAYRLLSKYVNPFIPNTDYKEIYQMGMSAASVGKIRDAVTFLKIARMKAPAADTEYVEKIDKNLLLLDGDRR